MAKMKIKIDQNFDKQMFQQVIYHKHNQLVVNEFNQSNENH